MDRRKFFFLACAIGFGALVISCQGRPMYGAADYSQTLSSQQIADLIDREYPMGIRYKNRHGGSCVFVSTQVLAERMGLPGLAQYIARNYRGGEYSSRLHRKLDSLGVRFAATTRADERFLDWCLGNYGAANRGACIVLKGPHMLNLVYLDRHTAIVIDNNRPHHQERWSRSRLIQNWKRSGGWAFCLLSGSPPPPDSRI